MYTNAINIKKLSIHYRSLCLFDEFNLSIGLNESWAFLGRSGVGKSTLMYAIAGLLHDGDAQITGKITDNENNSLTRKIAWLSQKDSLLPWLTVLENVMLKSRLSCKLFSKIKKEDIAKAKELLVKVGLEYYFDSYPDSLSGGQRRRVSIARTLYCDAPIVLMDEPFSALDAITKLELQDLSVNLLQNRTVLLITHEPLEALRMADVITVMRGEPVKLSEPIRLSTATPRDVEDNEILKLQGQLLQCLRHDKESIC